MLLSAEQYVILPATDRSKFVLLPPQKHSRIIKPFSLEEFAWSQTFCLDIFEKNYSTSPPYFP